MMRQKCNNREQQLLLHKIEDRPRASAEVTEKAGATQNDRVTSADRESLDKRLTSCFQPVMHDQGDEGPPARSSHAALLVLS